MTSPIIVGIDTGSTGKIAVLDIEASVEDRITILDMPETVDKYLYAPSMVEVLESIVDRKDISFYLEKSAIGQRIRGAHTAATNFGVTYSACTMVGLTNIVHAKTWQATMRRYADENGWRNRKANRSTKNLPSLIAYAFAPQFAVGVEGKVITIDDNIADAICIALHGAMVEGLIDRIMVKG